MDASVPTCKRKEKSSRRSFSHAFYTCSNMKVRPKALAAGHVSVMYRLIVHHITLVVNKHAKKVLTQAV